MAKQSVCQVCDASFSLKKREEKLVKEMAAKGEGFIMLECPECGRGTHYVDATILKPVIQPTSTIELQYRCPASHCVGWVTHIDMPSEEPSFLGCGECGRVWQTKKELYTDIQKIIKKYSYRRTCYMKTNEDWIPGDPMSEDPNYDRKVENEPI